MEREPTVTLALVALPWSSAFRPSAAIGTLSAFVRHSAPHVAIESHYTYMHVARALGTRLYTQIAERCYRWGELLYLPLLYPENRSPVVAHLAAELQRELGATPIPVAQAPRQEHPLTWLALVEQIMESLARHIERTAEELSRRADVVGLTTCFGQLFANLALCARLKAIDPGIVTVLGGSTVSDRVGVSLLAEYDAVDYIIQGEGESPLLGLVERMASARPADGVAGLLSRSRARLSPQGVPLAEVGDMDSLPIPLYDEYAELADALRITWSIPVEGSRGCWWDRVKKTKNSLHTCYFCNLNVQWNGYREKTVERVVAEVDYLTSRYRRGELFFLDNIIRGKGIEELAVGLSRLGKDLRIFYEMRANVRPAQLFLLFQAGVRTVQLGIESMSSSMLKKIGKGTTTIQNLEAMRACFELGISNHANLIIGFPTVTQEEIKEIRYNIEHYASIYEPLNYSEFTLGVGSTVETIKERFGVTNVRNSDHYRIGLPEAVWQRLDLLDLSFDLAGQTADWSPVVEALQRWKARHCPDDGKPASRLLEYRDGGDHLRIRDRRGEATDYVLRGAGREIYLLCTTIQTESNLARRYGVDLDSPDGVAMKAFLRSMVEKKLMFHENSRYLSLAVAPDILAATRRIMKYSREEIGDYLDDSVFSLESRDIVPLVIE